MQWDQRSQNYIEDDRSRLNVLPSKLVKHALFFYYWNHYNTLQERHFLAPTLLFIYYIQFLFDPNASGERRMRIFLFKPFQSPSAGLLTLDGNQTYLTSAINFPRNDLRLWSVSVGVPTEKRGKSNGTLKTKASSATRHDAVSCWC